VSYSFDVSTHLHGRAQTNPTAWHYTGTKTLELFHRNNGSCYVKGKKIVMIYVSQES